MEWYLDRQPDGLRRRAIPDKLGAVKTLLKLLRLEFLPSSADFALLALRGWLGLTMFFNHGLDKLINYSDKASDFPDPLGVGSHLSLGLAVLGEAVSSALLVLGLFARLAALIVGTTMAVAFFKVHQAALTGPRSGEVAFIYLAGFVALFIAGPGRFSLDHSGSTGRSAS